MQDSRLDTFAQERPNSDSKNKDTEAQFEVKPVLDVLQEVRHQTSVQIWSAGAAIHNETESTRTLVDTGVWNAACVYQMLIMHQQTVVANTVTIKYTDSCPVAPCAMCACVSCRADVVQVHPFKMYQAASLELSDLPPCPGIPDVQAEQMVPLDKSLNFLMILGAQKAGTTWLFDALDTHPFFTGAEHGYR